MPEEVLAIYHSFINWNGSQLVMWNETVTSLDARDDDIGETFLLGLGFCA